MDINGGMTEFFATVGRVFLNLCAGIGRFAIFTADSVRCLFSPPYFFRVWLTQFYRIGWLSLPLIALTALFTGAVLALQIYIGGSRFNAEQIVPSIVLIAILRELGPVLGGLTVAGRVSSAIAAEIGAMRATEQIDALTALSANPKKYLIAPRLLAATLALPALTLVADIIAIAGGYLTGVTRLGFNGTIYLKNTADNFVTEDLTSGLIKAGFFGFVIALSGCYHGYYSQGGAQGVGRATTSAVVTSSVLILALNYLLTEMFFSK